MKHSERAPMIQAILLFVVVFVYLLHVMWIIPTYVMPEKRAEASQYANYSLSAAIPLIIAGQFIAQSLDIVK
jgi:hypothetical protein